MYDTCKDFGKIIELWCKGIVPFTSFPLCQNRSIPDHRTRKPSTASNASGPFGAFEGHFVPPSPSSLDADHCSLFAGFLRSFVRNTVAENSTWSMSQGSQSIGSWARDACSRSTEPEEWIELVFSIFACNARFPIENSSSCAWKRNREHRWKGRGTEEANKQWSIDFIFTQK